MENYFLLIYSGEDNTPKLRLLTEEGVGDEMPADQATYFRENKVYLRHGNTCFYVYQPIGISKDELEFKEVISAGILGSKNGIPAWQLLNNMDKEEAVDVYEQRVLSTLQDAMIEKQVSRIH